jgi:hypothetical protein
MSTLVFVFNESLRPFRSPTPPPQLGNVTLRRLRLMLARDQQIRPPVPVTLPRLRRESRRP